jgi:hypothetical protein
MGNKSYSKGISWIDDCRIGFEDRQNQQKIFANGNGGVYKQSNTSKDEYVSVKGRFPANLLVSDDMLNDGVITKTTASKGHIRKGNVIGDNRTPVAAGLFGDGNWIEGTNINDKGTNSRYYDIDRWFNNLIDV